MAFTNDNHANEIKQLNGHSYIGNADYRGWLYADQGKHWALPFVGNDGSINMNAVNEYVGQRKGMSADDFTYGLQGYWDQYQKNVAPAWKQPAVLGASTGGGSGGNSTSGMTAAQRAAIDSQYNQTKNHYEGLLGTIDPRKKAAEATIDRSVDDSAKSLKGERDMAMQNLDREDDKVEKSYTRGRQSLGEQVRNMLQSESNAIGMMGGGNSSAMDMLAFAASDVQNAEQGQMLDDVNEQKTDISINRNQVEKRTEDELRKLNTFKQSKYQEIQDNFNEQRNAILNQLNVNENWRAAKLAEAKGISEAEIRAVDTVIQDRLNQIVATYQNIQAPTVSLADIPAYEASRITTPDANLGGGAPGLSPGQAADSITPRRREDDRLVLPSRREDDIQF